MGQPRRTRTYLEGATYELKDFIKHLGGRWDKERKAWYVLGLVPELLSDLVEPEPGKARRFPRSLDLDIENEPQAKAAGAKAMLRKPPVGDAQTDFWVPSLYDIAGKDNRSTMDVAIFRLSKKELRPNEILRYELPNGSIEVSSGVRGMASVWDYDIVLMAISHLTEAANRWRDGLSPKPGPVFRPHVAEILKFCRKGDGGRQSETIEAALDRLATTTIKYVHNEVGKDAQPRRIANTPEGLIKRGQVVSHDRTGKILSVEIEVPEWLYRDVVETNRPDVLTVHRDYFLIEQGIGRFIYRLARRAAGRGDARWSFKTIYERSGSTGTLKKFTENLRRVIQANDLPEYALAESKGQDGPLLVMTFREAGASLPVASGESQAASS